MAQSAGRGRVVGDYLVGRRIGSGSFSVVWHARHRVHGTEVAIKEIVTSRLNKKLQESLLSEIHILKKIIHPNIIRLHDIIEVPGKIHLVLEYCKGGDLSLYIQRHGRVPEETAKHFMQQLATGLQILRGNNLIHRDLKPQNLLLSSNDDRSVLKIADFGFARSLQPRGLAETLCGSPLYMAPEIMQLQKYDAKADLWSVGAILFQLVTGRTPFTGSTQDQLLQNILRSTELQFPPDYEDLSSECKSLCQKLLRRNPVERLTFEEFFNHSFVSQKQQAIDGSSSRQLPKAIDCLPSPEFEPVKKTEVSPHDDCFPFNFDEECSGSGASPSSSRRRVSMDSTRGFDVKRESSAQGLASNTVHALPFRRSRTAPVDRTGFRLDTNKPSQVNLSDPLNSVDQRSIDAHSKVADSLELIDQDYVLVSGPPMDGSSSSATASKANHFPCKLQSPPRASANIILPSSAPVPIIGAANISTRCIGSLESPDSGPGTSLESTDMGDILERPSTHCVTRIRSLQQCANAIKELVNEKIESRRHLEAFSIQLVILAIWKQALDICHTQAASAMEGSPSQGTARLKSSDARKNDSPDTGDCLNVVNNPGQEDISHQIEGEFLREVEYAEHLAQFVEPGTTEMPDAMETIFQSALALGRHGGVEELMGETETAASLYSKAVHLLVFLLVEAPSLILNPPFSLTNTDRYRLRNYIENLNSRQGHLRSAHVARQA